MGHTAKPEPDVATRAARVAKGGAGRQMGTAGSNPGVLPGDFRRRVEWWHKVSSYLHLFRWSR